MHERSQCCDSDAQSSAPPNATRPFLGPIAYGLLFCGVIPAALAVWVCRLNVPLIGAVKPAPTIGWPVLIAGVVTIVWSMMLLIGRGRGLPMNAYPTTVWVRQGPYRLVAHPIYAGFVASVCGMSIILGSAKGLFIGAPLAVLGCAALVFGYEGPATQRRLGPPRHRALLSLPSIAEPERMPTPMERTGAVVTVFGIWLALYGAATSLPISTDAWSTWLAFEEGAPFVPATVIVYSLTYVWAPLPLALVRTMSALRGFAESGLLGTAIGIATFVLMPTVTPFRGDPGFDPLGMLLAVQRATDSPATALPSFHVFWIVLAGRFLAIDRRRTSQVMLLIIGLLQIAACHLTGMHSLIDIAGGVALAALALAARPLARCGLRVAQTVVDSAGCVHVGPLRIFFHGLAVLAAASTGYVVALAFLPLGKSPLPLHIVALAALAGAGLWGQFVEGGGTSRPFGFFGGLLAAVACVAVLVLRGDMGLQYAAAATIALPFTQAVGRLRCLMHGCCHGRLCAATEAGLRYTHPLSRVAGIAALAGRPIMATQIFSLVTNVVIGLVLVRLAIFDNDIAHILAAYLVLMGLARCCEEAWRGEPQTPVHVGLNLYQWLAIPTVAAGLILALQTPLGTLPAPHLPRLVDILSASPIIFLWAIAFSVDWPGTKWPLSRLATSMEPASDGRGAAALNPQ